MINPNLIIAPHIDLFSDFKILQMPLTLILTGIK
jgi:hypothetical protein